MKQGRETRIFGKPGCRKQQLKSVENSSLPRPTYVHSLYVGALQELVEGRFGIDSKSRNIQYASKKYRNLLKSLSCFIHNFYINKGQPEFMMSASRDYVAPPLSRVTVAHFPEGTEVRSECGLVSLINQNSINNWVSESQSMYLYYRLCKWTTLPRSHPNTIFVIAFLLISIRGLFVCSSNLRMPSPNITTVLATEEDALTLASIMTIGFSSSDTAYPLIWGGAPEGTHDAVALKGLFSPVQKEGRLTFKAMHDEQLVGFATWNLPKPKVEAAAKAGLSETKRSELPEIPGVNMELWSDKSDGPKRFYYRDVDPSKDICTFPSSTACLLI